MEVSTTAQEMVYLIGLKELEIHALQRELDRVRAELRTLQQEPEAAL